MPKEDALVLITVIMCLPHSDLREAVTRLRSAEVNAVTGVLKLYFRELPQPLIPTVMFQSLARMLGKTRHKNFGGFLLKLFKFEAIRHFKLPLFSIDMLRVQRQIAVIHRHIIEHNKQDAYIWS